MFKELEIFKISHAMSSHAAHRQSVIARNMANADTPGYAAQDVAPFSEVIETSTPAFGMRATRSQHLQNTATATALASFSTSSPSAPNGNNVSLEEEMLKAVDVKRQHDKALAIYKSGLSVLRATLGRN